MTKANPFSTRRKIMTVLAEAHGPMDAVEIAALSRTNLQSTKGALSGALAANVIHVSHTKRCRGGKRRFYVIGAAPVVEVSKLDPFEILRAMQDAARRYQQFRREA